MHTLALHRRYAYNEEFKDDKDCASYPAPLRRIFNSNYMNVALELVRSDSETTTTIAPPSSTGPSKEWTPPYSPTNSASTAPSKTATLIALSKLHPTSTIFSSGSTPTPGDTPIGIILASKTREMCKILSDSTSATWKESWGSMTKGSNLLLNRQRPFNKEVRNGSKKDKKYHCKLLHLDTSFWKEEETISFG